MLVFTQEVTYTSPGIQTSLLKILGDMIRKSVCDGVKEAKMFSLLPINIPGVLLFSRLKSKCFVPK